MACEVLAHGWRFQLVAWPKIHGCKQMINESRCFTSNPRLRAPEGDGDCYLPVCYAQYNDTEWKATSLPHDFLMERAPSIAEATSSLRAWAMYHGNNKLRESEAIARTIAEMHGALPIGQAWYRRRLDGLARLASGGSHVWLEFDGVMESASSAPSALPTPRAPDLGALLTLRTVCGYRRAPRSS